MSVNHLPEKPCSVPIESSTSWWERLGLLHPAQIEGESTFFQTLRLYHRAMLYAGAIIGAIAGAIVVPHPAVFILVGPTIGAICGILAGFWIEEKLDESAKQRLIKEYLDNSPTPSDRNICTHTRKEATYDALRIAQGLPEFSNRVEPLNKQLNKIGDEGRMLAHKRDYQRACR